MIFKPLEADDLKDAINSLGLPGGEEALCLCRRVPGNLDRLPRVPHPISPWARPPREH